jgi:hypothetical protein
VQYASVHFHTHGPSGPSCRTPALAIARHIRHRARRFVDLADRDKRDILKLMARVAEQAYRRGVQQGAGLAGKSSFRGDLWEWRYRPSLDLSPWVDSPTTTTSPLAESLGHLTHGTASSCRHQVPALPARSAAADSPREDQTIAAPLCRHDGNHPRGTNFPGECGSRAALGPPSVKSELRLLTPDNAAGDTLRRPEAERASRKSPLPAR